MTATSSIPTCFPEDRQAIGTVQDAMQKWGKFTLVYEPQQADIVLMVTSRPSEDILAVYDAHGWPQNQYLWRMMGRSGLQTGRGSAGHESGKGLRPATSRRTIKSDASFAMPNCNDSDL